jgi:hypothetical protein
MRSGREYWRAIVETGRQRAAEEHWERDQKEIVNARIRNPHPNDFIEQRAELRDSGLDEEQIRNRARLRLR